MVVRPRLIQVTELSPRPSRTSAYDAAHDWMKSLQSLSAALFPQPHLLFLTEYVYFSMGTMQNRAQLQLARLTGSQLVCL